MSSYSTVWFLLANGVFGSPANFTEVFPTPSSILPVSEAIIKRPFGETNKNSISLEKTKKILVNYFSKKKSNEKMEALRFMPGLDENASKGYGMTSKTETPKTDHVSRDEKDDRMMVAGIPDQSDECFRLYSNAIIVNAQPYERRSFTSLIKCKARCLHSQTGVYSCRSFVYDNTNQVCDLFAHVGDQAPARLLKFHTRDYFEPTNAVKCLNIPNPDEFQEEARAHSSSTDERKVEEEKVEVKEEIQKDDDEQGLVDQKLSVDEVEGTKCPAGKKVGFLRTAGFELYQNDEISLPGKEEIECAKLCGDNFISGQKLDCKSFDYTDDTCHFSSDAAVPVGDGQLKQRSDAFYYEKICVNDNIDSGCASAFNRFPQMVLVGFAESVSDSATFEHCFDSCINSQQLFGFNCTSGMYYFEEAQLNCILNTENRETQNELFAEENTDIVDYFEIGCHSHARRVHGVKTLDATAIRMEKLVIANETMTDWSPCKDQMQHRRRDCKDKSDCGLESRPCGTTQTNTKKKPKTQLRDKDLPTKEEVLAVKARIKKEGFNCPTDTCCDVFGSCKAGLMQSSKTRQFQWCRTPCGPQLLKTAKKRRMRLL